MQLSNKAVSHDQPYWENHLKAHLASGLNRKQYCRRHELAYHQFQYWYRRLVKPIKKTKAIPIKLTDNNVPTLQAIATLKLSTGHELMIHDKSVIEFILSRKD